MADDRSTRPLGEALGRVVGGLGARSVMLDLHANWPEIVGVAIAEHCRPRRIEDSLLLVEVDHPGWATEIRYLERQIVAKLAVVMPGSAVESIHVSVGRPRD